MLGTYVPYRVLEIIGTTAQLSCVCIEGKCIVEPLRLHAAPMYYSM